jgi:hypothetical protein
MSATVEGCEAAHLVEGCEVAHLCPRTEDSWFHNNAMQLYINDLRKLGVGEVNDTGNVMLLRSDLHTSFNQMKLYSSRMVNLRKGLWLCISFLGTQFLRDQWRQLVLDPLSKLDAAELSRLYQNTSLQTTKGVRGEFLFARFAWSIFPLVEGFLRAGVKRFLIRASAPEPSMALPEECASYTRQPIALQPRNASPRNVLIPQWIQSQKILQES